MLDGRMVPDGASAGMARAQRGRAANLRERDVTRGMALAYIGRALQRDFPGNADEIIMSAFGEPHEAGYAANREDQIWFRFHGPRGESGDLGRAFRLGTTLFEPLYFLPKFPGIDSPINNWRMIVHLPTKVGSLT